ncbi:mechanosensitive ion channel-like protein [Rhodopseudomonas faecalis]|uniref:Mechanosensitive ion channel-like protein n=1 Tax=Rhodopseudomonas faecalis TaxID=99655 RepID=A0A318TBQ2_9BRAD|nr:mechanosensitive ion channel domain-containing protein [Rhodopseudomonas faecalis]PYF01177.1 mechanosensitive ion channel-like protein [Rhodopseudomonas faecalis]TAH66045.1 MAG: mechanosensitive ion channel [Rhodopseudomonas palustris]
MDLDLNLTAIYEALLAGARSVGAEVTSPWFYFQLGLIMIGTGISYAVGAVVRSRVDLGHMTMGWPAPLRLFGRVLVGSASTAVFAIVMIAARAGMIAWTWPSRSYLLAVAAKLALAWLVIRLATSMIRNGFLVRLVSLSAWLVAALSILGQLEATVDALDSVAIMISGLRLTPLLVIKLTVLLGVALWLTNVASRFLEGRIAQSRDLTPSIQVLLIKLVRVGLMVVAVAVVLSSVGINLSALAIFSGAIGVGIGLGLQKIVANFISGVILLADKSVKPGDLVTIGDSSGRISAMNTRYISVAAGDGREFLIPNEDLVTQKVVNWTYTDKNTLVKVNFGTNYEADPRLVCQLAVGIAAKSPRATKGKTPTCLLTEFAEAGMKFTLTFWISEPDGMDGVRSDVMLALWDAFKREGIKVPTPIREIRVRDGALAVEATIDGPHGGPVPSAGLA